VKAVHVSLRHWCLTGRLGSRYMAGKSSGGIAKSEQGAHIFGHQDCMDFSMP